MPFVLAASVEASCPGNVMVLLLNSSAAGKIRCCKKTLAATNRSTLQTSLLVNYLDCARGPCLNLFEITYFRIVQRTGGHQPAQRHFVYIVSSA